VQINIGKYVTCGEDWVTSDYAGGGCTDATALHWLSISRKYPHKETVLAKNQYTFEKRRREIEKKRKKEEKLQRKIDKVEPSPEENAEAPVAQDETQPTPQE
jgi:hypothetical protein